MFGVPQGKYIIVDDQPVLFMETMEHQKVASAFHKDRVTSAGFFNAIVLEDGSLSVACYGESLSLNLKAAKEDSALVKAMIMGWLEH